MANIVLGGTVVHTFYQAYRAKDTVDEQLKMIEKKLKHQFVLQSSL